MKRGTIMVLALALTGTWFAVTRVVNGLREKPADFRDALSDSGSTAVEDLSNTAAPLRAVESFETPRPVRADYANISPKVLRRYPNSPLPAGKVERTQRPEFIWENPDCKTNPGCKVKSARFAAWDYRVSIEGSLSFGTGFSAHYGTSDVPALEKYGFVQWIKGCVFESQAEKGGITYAHSIDRPYWQAKPDEVVMFQHPRWALDSTDRDPVYLSSPGVPHPGGYKWNTVKGSVESSTMKRYYYEKPALPELYVTDFPGGAGTVYKDGKAKNISLMFRTCLYAIQDVPKTCGMEAGEFPNALVCHNRPVSYIYNHSKKVFESWDGLHPECERERSDIESAMPGDKTGPDRSVAATGSAE